MNNTLERSGRVLFQTISYINRKG